MSIFKKSLFDLRSGEQRAADYAAYQEYMFPLGKGQQERIKAALQGVPKKAAEEKLLFLFYVTKERYVEERMKGRPRLACWQGACKALQKFPFAPKADLPFLLSLAVLDMEAESLEDYPQREAIQALSQRLFPGSAKQPDWSALS